MNATFNGVTFLTTATAGNVAGLRAQALDDWYYPDVSVVPGGIEVDGVYRVGDQTGLDPSIVSEHEDLLSSSPFALLAGDLVYEVSWTVVDDHSTVHDFTTLGWEDSSGDAVFETFIFLFPQTNSPTYIKQTSGGGQDINFIVTRKVGGTGASGSGGLSLLCNNDDTIATCTAVLTGPFESFLYDAELTHEPEEQFVNNERNCCKAVFRFGFAYGFKSISVGADGFSLSVSGSLGVGDTAEKLIIKCCEGGTAVGLPGLTEWGIVATVGSISIVVAYVVRRRRRPA